MVSAASGSPARRRVSPNPLFYGPPGTGKTKFAKTLCIGFSVQFVGETNDKNGEPSRSERSAALLIANAIAAVGRRTILVVDEADRLFDAFKAADGRGSKVFLNRMLERSAAPTIWRILIPPCGGSNPPAPATQFASSAGTRVFRKSRRLFHCRRVRPR